MERGPRARMRDATFISLSSYFRRESVHSIFQDLPLSGDAGNALLQASEQTLWIVSVIAGQEYHQRFCNFPSTSIEVG